ncbi:hypothetical protein PAHAL_3G016700 [Panicum hallii]|uniref:Uncharacterized protein n=1 Tax=Panicum hallii TaxID=206008 RepID=A0A2T8KGS7_9POAL|nr:hypothetical protein PAHAL_3G016700 [Panicum hallii]
MRCFMLQRCIVITVHCSQLSACMPAQPLRALRCFPGQSFQPLMLASADPRPACAWIDA